jgi:Leucine-rich repeat (LRR) protein
MTAMRQAAEMDGDSPSGKCEDVAQALAKMTTLDLSRLALTETSPIALVKNLKIVLIAENNFKTIAPLTALPKIIGVNVDGNRFPLTCPFKDKNICTGIE